ncbi:DNA-processing protein DprA [Dorea sp. AGR2135]|uniref:DNA-processing protein DprA n=1 Tax=Dorea sp. AGR2135 TaxID=1280669 RepID=UPI000418B5BB|nr:DNA-processing protein DprA [Dorea sp. AGR2135]
MEKYYIALYKLGIKNELLLKAITEYDSDFIIHLFEGNTDIFLTNIEWLEYKNIFEDHSSLLNALEAAETILQINKQNEIHTALYATMNYPHNLMSMDNPPAIVYYKGANPNRNFEKAIACIGTRKPTRFGFNAINYLIPQWVNEGFAIISGLAAGVDRLAHIACLAEGGKTIAVLAHGLDMIYPASNRKLAEKILLCDGTLLSEYPVGTKPDKFRFVNRNRLIVGLSKVTVAMECERKSGSMHTIEFAQKQNCPIFCPDPGDNPKETQSGLKYILDNNIGSLIKNGLDYQNVIISAGYNIEHPSMNAKYIKEQYLKALIAGIEDDLIIKSIFEKIGLNYTSDCSCLINLNNYLLDFIQNTGYPIQTIIDLFIENIISTYNPNEKES